MNEREKNMSIWLRKLGFSEYEFNIYWKLGVDALEEMFPIPREYIFLHTHDSINN